ncbi:low temperature requirement protein A [Micromonospora sp. R77]|uniref:low temperature requirement protein A n=1 Tax=Micromonospora sp. R77 TaxID=2925836 RepID=UPI001F61AE8A|nr:low temperature requirement protein A [Micromonospora sp. R77]MCI4061899.1 low temperature requirement protein A [Micromonospora sp. R77]
MRGGWRRHVGPTVEVAPGARADRFEILFDLVYVFSFFIISRAATAELTGRGLLHAMLLLAVLWWCWVIHSVVANRVRLGEGFVPAVVVVVIIAVFAFALASPRAFRDSPEGLSGPLVVACSYLVIRLVLMALYVYAVRDEPSRIRRLGPFVLELAFSVSLLFAAALVPPRVTDPETAALVRDGLWVVLVVFQYATPLVAGTASWTVSSAEHWTERYDLILMIALGESLISVGIGSNVIGLPITWPTLVAAALGIVGIAALWWAHFDLVAPAARLAMHGTRGDARTRLARDAYGHLYLIMLAGIVIFALGGEELMHQVSGPQFRLGDPLHGTGALLLYGGTVCFLVGDLLFQLRVLHTVTWTRVGAIVALTGLGALSVHLPLFAAFGLLIGVELVMMAVEMVVLASSREALREGVLEERLARERFETAWRQRRFHDQPDDRRG